MATKPTIALARFADQPGADVTDPSSGLRDTGFQAGTPASQGYVNALFRQSYLWALYLNDGALTGSHSIDGALAVAGAVTVSGAEVVAGAITIGGQPLTISAKTFTANNTNHTFTSTAHTLETGDGPVRVTNTGGALPAGLTAITDYWVIRLTADTFKLATSFALAIAGSNVLISTNGTGTQTLASTAGTTRATDATVSRSLAVGGNTTVGGTLAVTGGATVASATVIGGQTVGGTLGVTGNTTVGGTLGVTGASTLAAVTASGIITANAGVVAATNQDIVVSGTGLLKHGKRTLKVPLFQAGTTGLLLFSNTFPVVLSELWVGCRILGVSARVRDNVSLTLHFFSITDGVASADIAVSSASSGSATFKTLSITGLTTTVAVGLEYAISITCSPVGGASSALASLEVDVDQP